MAGKPATTKARAQRGLFRLWQTHRLLVIAFAAALAFSIFFAVRATLFYSYWHDHRDQPLETWMTPGYVAHSWDVELDVVIDGARIVRQPGERRPLGRIADDRGVSFETLAKEIGDAIARDRARHSSGQPQ